MLTTTTNNLLLRSKVHWSGVTDGGTIDYSVFIFVLSIEDIIQNAKMIKSIL